MLKDLFLWGQLIPDTENKRWGYVQVVASLIPSQNSQPLALAMHILKEDPYRIVLYQPNIEERNYLASLGLLLQPVLMEWISPNCVNDFRIWETRGKANWIAYHSSTRLSTSFLALTKYLFHIIRNFSSRDQQNRHFTTPNSGQYLFTFCLCITTADTIDKSFSWPPNGWCLLKDTLFLVIELRGGPKTFDKAIVTITSRPTACKLMVEIPTDGLPESVHYSL